MVKKILFVNQQAPHGTAFSYEKLQMAMVFGAFEVNVSMLFMGNGIFSLMKNQHTQEIGLQNFSKQYRSLEQYYEISNIYVDQHSLEIRALSPDNLLIPVVTLDHIEINTLMHEQDFIINS